MLHRARIIKAPRQAVPVREHTSGSARLVRRTELEAHTAAEQIRQRAKAEANAVKHAALSEAETIKQRAREEGWAQGISEATARCVHLTQLEAEADNRELDRWVQLARLLAERLLGKALELDQSLVLNLAEQTLSEVRGAKRITLSVSVTDYATLKEQFAQLGVTSAALHLRPDDDLKAGDFQLTTDVGSLDATLGSRLDLLSEKLRESLHK